MNEKASCCLCGTDIDKVIVRCRKAPVCVKCHTTVVSLNAAQFDDPEALELLTKAYAKAELAHAKAGRPENPDHFLAKQRARVLWGDK